MKRSVQRVGLFILLIMYIFATLCGCSMGASYDPTTACMQTNVHLENTKNATWDKDINISSRIYELIFGHKEKAVYDPAAPLMLIPSGDVFGIRITEEHPTVSEAPTSSPLKRGDKIVSISGTEISDSSDISELLSKSGGMPVKIDILRSGMPMSVTLKPKEENGKYLLGVTLRKMSAGIGTLTFIYPKSGIYGGLGHCVSEPESANPITIKNGEATRVILGSVKRGAVGTPGELSGIIDNKTIGSIDRNTECGIFGVLTDTDDLNMDEAIPVSKKGELKEGEAEIISTVKNGKKARYKILITDIDYSSDGSKSFKIKVTDPALIALTGGIVRGMSGSPIIQDGKLAGAVTHVMINDPTEGYGVFIENMLSDMQSQIMPRVA